VTTLLQHQTPEAPVSEPAHFPGPRQEVERVDALSCKAKAVKRIGDHCVCLDHEREVRLAYWATDANLILHEVLPNEYFECGDVYIAPEVSR
jgi:hypothetical protein